MPKRKQRSTGQGVSKPSPKPVDENDLVVDAKLYLELQEKCRVVAAENIDLSANDKLLKTKINELTVEVAMLRTVEPPKMDKKKIQTAVDTLLYSLLMDAKGALMTSGDPSAAEVALRISQMELNMPALTLLETMLIQRSKGMARKWASGLEVDPDEINSFFKLAEKLV